MPEIMENPELFDGEMAFEDRIIDQLATELEAHQVDADTISQVREKLRMSGAVRYEDEHGRFVIKRNLSQGFDIEWNHSPEEKAA